VSNTPTSINNLQPGAKYQYRLSSGQVKDGIFVNKHENGRIMMKQPQEPNVLAESVSPNATFYRLQKSRRNARKNRKNTRKNRKN
jgi:hypothetical protein